MKKFLKIVLIATMVCSMVMCSACKSTSTYDDDEDFPNGEVDPGKVIIEPADQWSQDEPESNDITNNEFYDMVEGCWLYKDHDGLLNVLRFADGVMDDFVYCGEMWVSGAVIKDVTKEGDKFRVKMSYVEVEYGEEGSGTPREAEYLFSSRDDFDDTLIANGDNGDSWEYRFIGETYSQAEKIMEKEFFN